MGNTNENEISLTDSQASMTTVLPGRKFMRVLVTDPKERRTRGKLRPERICGSTGNYMVFLMGTNRNNFE